MHVVQVRHSYTQWELNSPTVSIFDWPEPLAETSIRPSHGCRASNLG